MTDNTQYPGTPISDGFDSPVGIGVPSTLTADGLWLSMIEAVGHYFGLWRSTNDIYNEYELGLHTGSDLVLSLSNTDWFEDAHKPITSPVNAVVTYAQRWPTLNAWGNIIILRTFHNGKYVWLRLAHIESMRVKVGDRVTRGQNIADVGNAFGLFAYHLHFDICLSGKLERWPGDWPGLNRARIDLDYTDPLQFIRANRPKEVLMPMTLVTATLKASDTVDVFQLARLSSPVVRRVKVGETITIDTANIQTDPETGVRLGATPDDMWVPVNNFDIQIVPVTREMFVNSDIGLYVRATPGGTKIDGLTNNTLVTVQDSNTLGWVQLVKVRGVAYPKAAYVSDQYLKKA